MGCGASRNSPGPRFTIQNHDPTYIEINEAWDRAWKTVEAESGSGKKLADLLVVKRTGWKTVRIFVSSTFKDFHQERECLVKKVFPDLRVWCEARRLYLVECDLRWGVPKDFTTEATLRACLGEIDRCYQDNVMPYFLNMTSERMGWVPLKDEVPEAVRSEYKWIEGLSVTEMEIMHGAYRKDNPNALFLLRDPSFLSRVPEDHKGYFVDSQPIAGPKLDVLKQMIKDRFKDKKRIITYPVDYLGINPETNSPEIGGLDGLFSQTVLDFFKERISKQYPLDQVTSDPFAQQKESHDAFLKSRCDSVVGRDDIVKSVKEYISADGSGVPFLLLGNAGSGKSSIMAKMADIFSTAAMQGSLKGGGKKGWKVFYHFVGAVPGSTELFKMILRLLKETGLAAGSEMPGSLDAAAQLTAGALANSNAQPTIIIVDALNQLDEDLPATINSWLPRQLSPNIRCVFSMIPDTPQHQNFLSRDPKPTTLEVAPLTEHDRRAIVDSLLGRYNKKLDDSQMTTMMNKSSSANPLWLSIACEELRVFGYFRQISQKVESLADGLLELEQQVLSRFEQENGGELLVAAVCLLEVSARGLLEIELLTILGDEENLMPHKNKDSGKEKDDGGREKSSTDIGQLPAYKWSEVYRALRPFLRPFGDSGEGRLDFYHRSLSKAVRKKYFQKSESGEADQDIYHWWHLKLANYFEYTCNIINRKVEELPYHLVKIKDKERLESVLVDWQIFDKLYDDVYSAKLIQYWREGSELDRMDAAYSTALNNIMNLPETSKDDLCLKTERVAKLLAQSGHYTSALEFGQKAIELEKQHLGSRPERLCDLYMAMGSILDEEMKLAEYMYRSQLPRMQKIIMYFEDSIKLRRTLPTSDIQQKKLGRTLNRLSFYYTGYALRGGDDWMSVKEAKEKSTESIDTAIQVFKQLQDEVNVVDCLTTKGVSYGSACPEQIANYKEAYEKGVNATGKVHPNMDRLCLNMAIYYEESGDYYGAFEWFHLWYTICNDLYGAEHPKAARPVNTLREPMYRRIAQEKGIAVPELPK